MSATGRSTRSQEADRLTELPRFQLSFLYDDGDEPAEVTVFPASDDYDISTNWISVGVDAAVPLEDVR